MNNSNNTRTLFLAIILATFSVGYTFAQNTVVVVPLAGEDAIKVFRVSANISVGDIPTTCHSHGNQSCYIGAVDAFCPAGTKVIGGGVGHTIFGGQGSINNNAPTPDNSGWRCAVSYQSANHVAKCYAICTKVS